MTMSRVRPTPCRRWAPDNPFWNRHLRWQRGRGLKGQGLHGKGVSADENSEYQGLRSNVMGTFSIWHILILAAIALVLFGGRGKVSDLMGDFGKGINSFKKGLSEHDKEDPKVINAEAKDKDKTTV
jgi:sec-independent protein translocase protein TatA